MDIIDRLSQNVTALRKERGLSQEELAHQSGLHRTYISGIERGVRNPTVTILAKIAKALEIKPEKLIQ